MAAVIIGSSLAGVQISIKSRTVLGGNCDSVTLADAIVVPLINAMPTAIPASFISFPCLCAVGRQSVIASPKVNLATALCRNTRLDYDAQTQAGVHHDHSDPCLSWARRPRLGRVGRLLLPSGADCARNLAFRAVRGRALQRRQS